MLHSESSSVSVANLSNISDQEVVRDLAASAPVLYLRGHAKIHNPKGRALLHALSVSLLFVLQIFKDAFTPWEGSRQGPAM